MMWVYIPKTQNIVLWYLVWLSHEGSINCVNLDQCALFSVNTHTHTLNEGKQTFILQVCFLLVFLIKLSYVTSEMAHTLFFSLSKSLCFFLPKLMFLGYSQCQGWLAGSFTFPTGRKRLCGWERLSALWLTWWQGGQRCEESWHSQWYQEDRALHSSLTLLNRERMCERDGGKSVKESACEREKEELC